MLSGVTEKNAWSVMEAVAKLGGSVTLDATSTKATIPWNRGQDLLLSEVQKALEGTGASIDEHRSALTGPVRLHVAGITCGGCAARIKDALTKVDGIEDVTVDLRSKEEGYVRLASSAPVIYGAVRKAVAGTPFRLVDVSLDDKGKPVAVASVKKGPCCGHCGGGDGPCCAHCSKAQKAGTKVASKEK